MSNFHRGEISVELAGERFVLRLTLGALAEIEAAFGAPDLAALGERLGAGRLRAADLVTLLAACLRGGGATLSDQAVAQRINAADLPKLIGALDRVFTLSFAAPGEGAMSAKAGQARRETAKAAR